MKIDKPIPSLASFCCLAALGLTGQTFAQAGLTKVDINNPIAGTLTTNPDSSTTITAGGGDTYGTSDSFTYLYGQKTGDFDVKVRVADVNADDPGVQQRSAKASLQIRANLTPGSPNIQISATPTAGENYVETIARTVQNGETNDPPLSAPNFRVFGEGPWPGTFRPTAGSNLYPVWLRARRTGDLFQTMFSTDGLRWTVLAEYSMDPASFPETLYVGLAAVAHIDGGENPANRVRSTFSDYGDVARPPVANVNGTPVVEGNKPGTYPANSVTGVNWQISLPADGVGKSADNSQTGPIIWNTGGFGTISRDILLSIGSQQGPIPFSASRYAAGAIDFSIGPRDALAAQSNLGPYTNPSRDRETPAVTDPASQSWFPSPNQGILIPTVRVNGTVQWNDGAAPFYPHAYQAVDFSSAQYFHMDDGTFGNGPFYTRMCKRGDTGPHPDPNANSSAGFQRAAFNISTAWFPYAGGWMSGYFDSSINNLSADDGKAFWRSPGTHGASATRGTLTLDPNSADAILSWTEHEFGGYGGLATLSLPGVDSRDDGLLFLVPNDDSSSRGPQANCSVKSDGSGWNVAIRRVETISEPADYMPAGNDEFSFLHIPYTASNLTGGRIAGSTGAKVNSAGTFTVTRSAAGRYQITIPGETGETGMLILQAVGEVPGQPGLVDNVSLSYQYSNGSFVVESHTLDPFGAENGYAAASLRDSDFYFAWVDFSNPPSNEGPELPALSLQRNGATVTLSWPSGVTGYTLEASTNLANPWTTVPGVVNNSVTLPVTPALSKQFFRLRSTP